MPGFDSSEKFPIFASNNQLIMNIIITLLIGAAAGWLAGFFVVKEKGGLIWNIIIGLLGGVVGGWLLGKLGASGSF